MREGRARRERPVARIKPRPERRDEASGQGDDVEKLGALRYSARKTRGARKSSIRRKRADRLWVGSTGIEKEICTPKS